MSHATHKASVPDGGMVPRSARQRRKMAEKERRAAAKRFPAMTGITVPVALDGRPYMEDDFDAIVALIDATPRLKTLVDQFCEIDEIWGIS